MANTIDMATVTMVRSTEKHTDGNWEFIVLDETGKPIGLYSGLTPMHAVAAMHRAAGFDAYVVLGDLVTNGPAVTRDDIIVRSALDHMLAH